MDDSLMVVGMQQTSVNLRAVGAQRTGVDLRAETAHPYLQESMKTAEGRREPTSQRMDINPMVVGMQQTSSNPKVVDVW